MGIVELVGVANPLARDELQILAAECVALLRRKVRKGHPERAADHGVEVVDLARETVRRKPLDQRIGAQESAIDALGRRD
jgi:hypothetical protein